MDYCYSEVSDPVSVEYTIYGNTQQLGRLVTAKGPLTVASMGLGNDTFAKLLTILLSIAYQMF